MLVTFHAALQSAEHNSAKETLSTGDMWLKNGVHMVGWRPPPPGPFFRRFLMQRTAQKAPLLGVFVEVDKLPADPPGKMDHHTITYRHQHTYVIPFRTNTSSCSSNQQNSKPEHRTP
uniref:Uncharacterized protein n=1 Tax=Zea mays TaxID=4577 RepID=B8A3M3_MAIZE|nr:unknown [Zea mays]